MAHFVQVADLASAKKTQKDVCRPSEVYIRVRCSEQRGVSTIDLDYFAGYKKRHGALFQGTMLPCGLFISIHGSYSGRRNDAFIFRCAILISICLLQESISIPINKKPDMIENK